MRRPSSKVTRVLGASVLCASTTFAQQAAPRPVTAQPEAKILLARARAVATSLSSELMTRLGKELHAGGPAAAIGVCAVEAQAIAARLSVDGVTVRRVSAKPRNPADAPDAFEAEKLAVLASAHAAGKPVADIVVVAGTFPHRTLRLVRPITVASMCLACHGDRAMLDATVKKVLSERYPYDLAVGYKEGDLRGAISVTIDELALLR